MKTHIEHNSRNTAIKTALGSYLTEQQTFSALQLWDRKYAHQNNVSVQYFARECSNLFGMEHERSQMVKNLVRELYTQLYKLDHIQIRATSH